MIALRPAAERGHFDHGWLDTYHTFSFADYHDPDQMGFRALRVINEDRVGPGVGFPTHGHRDMEIVTWVLEGQLEHKDSLGTGSIIRPGDAQRMTAGRGILHSEMNPSKKEPVHLLQIWLLPEKRSLEPGYEQKHFPLEARRNRLRTIASRDGRDGSITIHTDAALLTGALDAGTTVSHALAKGRHAWVQISRGAVTVNGKPLRQGDGAALSDEAKVEVSATEPSEVLLFDLA
jgi:quercetin 2,3-dioxygenase